MSNFPSLPSAFPWGPPKDDLTTTVQMLQSILMPIIEMQWRKAEAKSREPRKGTYGSFGIPGIGQVGFGQASGGPEPYAMGGGGGAGGPAGGATIFSMMQQQDKERQEMDAVQRLATAATPEERSAVIKDIGAPKPAPGFLGSLGQAMGLSTHYTGPLDSVRNYQAAMIKTALTPKTAEDKLMDLVDPSKRSDAAAAHFGLKSDGTTAKRPSWWNDASTEEQDAYITRQAKGAPKPEPKPTELDRMTPDQRDRYLENKSHAGELKPSLFEKLLSLLQNPADKDQAIKRYVGVEPKLAATRPANPPTIAEQDDKRLTEDQRVQRAKVQAGITARPGQEKSFAASDEYKLLKAQRESLQNTVYDEAAPEEAKNTAQTQIDAIDDQIAAGLNMLPSQQEQEQKQYQIRPGHLWGQTLEYNSGTRQHPVWVKASEAQTKRYQEIISNTGSAAAKVIGDIVSPPARTSTQPTTQATATQPATKKLTRAKVMAFLEQAKGNEARARKLAQEAGYE